MEIFIYSTTYIFPPLSGPPSGKRALDMCLERSTPAQGNGFNKVDGCDSRKGWESCDPFRVWTLDVQVSVNSNDNWSDNNMSDIRSYVRPLDWESPPLLALLFSSAVGSVHLSNATARSEMLRRRRVAAKRPAAQSLTPVPICPFHFPSPPSSPRGGLDSQEWMDCGQTPWVVIDQFSILYSLLLQLIKVVGWELLLFDTNQLIL